MSSPKRHKSCPQTYKSYFLCRHVVVNSVARPVVSRVLAFPRTFPLAVVGVVADKSGAADQQVEQETEHLHADGDEEEDECVGPLVGDQQLGEDARQGDDHPGCTWGGRGGQRSPSSSWGSGDRCVSALTLSSHHPLRVPLGQHPHVTIETRLLH